MLYMVYIYIYMRMYYVCYIWCMCVYIYIYISEEKTLTPFVVCFPWPARFSPGQKLGMGIRLI